jgi:hypothetical protein
MFGHDVGPRGFSKVFRFHLKGKIEEIPRDGWHN